MFREAQHIYIDIVLLAAQDFNYVSGIVEADETLYLESYKGTKNIDSCKPRKRSGKTKKRGLNKKQLSVLIGIDRKGNIISKMAGEGKTTEKEVGKVFKVRIDKEAEFCSDAATNFPAYAKRKQLKHCIINASKGERVVSRGPIISSTQAAATDG